MKIIDEVYSLIESKDYQKATKIVINNIDILLADERNYYSLSWSVYRILKYSANSRSKKKSELFALLEIVRKRNKNIKDLWVERLLENHGEEFRELCKLNRKELELRITNLKENKDEKVKNADSEKITQFYMPDPRKKKRNKTNIKIQNDKEEKRKKVSKKSKKS
ncbi:MAG: hypothetical protein K8F60_07010 [Melioribacteraceae bacterium]|nr:hypothetical protein [Melioribacteraceae bacterium]